MNIAQIREALLWCVILNIGLVTVWSILVLVAKGWLNGIILKWFRVSVFPLAILRLGHYFSFRCTQRMPKPHE